MTEFVIVDIPSPYTAIVGQDWLHRMKGVATYQRMVTKIFEPILGKTMDAYIDDMVVKSKRESDHIRDLIEVFTILKRHKLRHLVTRRVIESNPK